MRTDAAALESHKTKVRCQWRRSADIPVRSNPQIPARGDCDLDCHAVPCCGQECSRSAGVTGLPKKPLPSSVIQSRRTQAIEYIRRTRIDRKAEICHRL